VALVYLFMYAMPHDLKEDSKVRLCSMCGDNGVHVVMLCVDLVRVADACAGISFKKYAIPSYYHVKVRTDCCVFIPPWMSIVLEDLDLTDLEHWKYLSWARLIMPFECAMSPSETKCEMGPMQSYELKSASHTTTLPMMCCAGEQWRHL